jgi:hypothetical protein
MRNEHNRNLMSSESKFEKSCLLMDKERQKEKESNAACREKNNDTNTIFLRDCKIIEDNGNILFKCNLNGLKGDSIRNKSSLLLTEGHP